MVDSATNAGAHRPATNLALVLDTGTLDPVMVAAHRAPLEPGLALVPEVGTLRTQPLRVSTMLATLDYAAHGLAGWLLAPDDDPERAAAFVDVVRALWDSWEEGAIVRDAATHRFLDRDKLHETLDAGGPGFSIRGPSITPRPPQGHVPVFVPVVDEASLQLAERIADVALVRDRAWGERVSVPVVLEQDDASLLAKTWDADAPTLRERLGLPTALNRYAATAGGGTA